METINVGKEQLQLLAIIEEMGPDSAIYPFLNTYINKISTKEDIAMFKEAFRPVLDEDTLFGYTLRKPLGYAGDYMLIEMMYNRHLSANPRLCNWDKYYHSQEAVKAVLNRKTYFVNAMEEIYNRNNAKTEVLILGSGPAADVHEFFSRNPNANVNFDLLDIDQRAIDYASLKNTNYLDRISFMKMNVLRFQPEKKYDLIWSAGLFDYLNDRYFQNLLMRYKNNLKKDGEMIIGNFSTANPTRRVMEIIGEWYLLHRNEQHLLYLANEADIPSDFLDVEKEPLGINLFLRIKPKSNFYINNFEQLKSKRLKLQY